MKPASLRARIARLDALLPGDPDLLCCLDGLAAWRDVLRPHYVGVDRTHLDLEAGDPEPPVDQPDPPLCQRTGGTLCSFACSLTAVHWTRRRRVALDFAGFTEEMIR
jgi:hypothetical protein